MAEVLSPAGDLDSLYSAVKSGADAVYLGLPDFNARRNAENFSDENLLDAINYCKINGVKVYITLNTCLGDAEIALAADSAVKAVNFGADAFIVADLGLAKVLKQVLPEIPLHASTQMSVQSPSALLILKEMGFSRVVIARECDKQSVAEIVKKANELEMEVEVFVHGALCMSVSGQCLLSSVLGGRSGNRGLCAGPCRLAFSVPNGTGYDLSLKDLSLVKYISELKEMGVASLKIEGRMKTPEYVSIATHICKLAVSGEVLPDDTLDLLYKVFSRSGFTAGYYENNLGKDMFGVRTEYDISLTKEVNNKIHSITRHEYQRVPLRVSFSAKYGEKTELTLSDGENSVTVFGEKPEKAENVAIDYGFVKSNIEKFGGTAYYSAVFSADIEDGLRVSASNLKGLRRNAVERLNEKRQTVKAVKTVRFEPINAETNQKKVTKFLARFRNTAQIPENLKNISAVILPVNEIEQNQINGVTVMAELPRGLIGNEPKIKAELKRVKSLGVEKAFCANIAEIALCREAGIEPIADVGLNVLNSYSLESLKTLGVKSGILSVENSVGAINKFSGFNTGFLAYGHIPLMLTRNCPNKNGIGCKDCGGVSFITDRMNINFPVCCSYGFTDILNSRPLYLLDRLNEFKTDFAVLYFSIETKQQAEDIILKTGMPQKPDFTYTRGLYYRTVQ